MYTERPDFEEDMEEQDVEPEQDEQTPPVESQEPDEPKDEVPEYTEEQQIAMSKGWIPDGVPGKPQISAEEFLRREELFDKISKQNHTIHKLESAMDEMAKQHSKIAELERQKVLDSLKEAKKQALAEEDYDRVIELDDKIEETRNSKEAEESETPKQSQTVDPDFQSWQSKNSWYDADKNPDLFQEATAIGMAFNQTTGKVGKELYEHVERVMRRMYPDRLGDNSYTQTAPAVESNARPTRQPRGKKRKFTKSDLNDVQRQVMNRYVRSGVLTEQEYIDGLVEIGELQ